MKHLDLDEATPRDEGKRWQSHRVLSVAVRATAFLVPIAISVAATTMVARFLPPPHGVNWTVGWWAIVLSIPLGVLALTDRLTRKLLPLAVLLKMTLVFPDQAPKRMVVARKAGSTRDLARKVEEAKVQGKSDEPVVAAEKILVLAGALNLHDRRTRGHSERVRMYTDLIAEEMRLPQVDRDRLRWSALLHDIGKVAVHPDILNKPGALDDDEWDQVRNHPLEGARLTAPLSAWLGQWADTMAEHHEKYDGTGYPRGLAGTNISLGARIVAVADAYDVMTAIRSYKPAMTPQAARAELLACAGSHFDPTVVRAFLDVSLGRVRVVAGPLAWAGSLPFVGNVSTLGQVGVAALRSAAVSITFVGAVAVGAVHVIHHPPATDNANTSLMRTDPASPQSQFNGALNTSVTVPQPISSATGGVPSSASVPNTPSGTTTGPSSTSSTSSSVTTTAASAGSATTVPSSVASTSGATATTEPVAAPSTTAPNDTTTTTPKSTTTTTTPKSTTTTTTAPKSTTTTTVKKLCLLGILFC